MRYDIEQLLVDIKQIMVDNLNTRIAAVNAEKNDGMTLSPIPAAAYFCQSMDGTQTNFDPFVFFGVESIDEDNSGYNFGYSPEKLTISVAIVVVDEGNTINIPSKLFRYQRALKETFEMNFNSISEGVKIAVQGQVPIDLALMNNKFRHKAIGVTLKVAMG